MHHVIKHGRAFVPASLNPEVVPLGPGLLMWLFALTTADSVELCPIVSDYCQSSCMQLKRLTWSCSYALGLITIQSVMGSL